MRRRFEVRQLSKTEVEKEGGGGVTTVSEVARVQSSDLTPRNKRGENRGIEKGNCPERCGRNSRRDKSTKAQKAAT